ncbi:MAG: cupin domain-containing protein [Gammaproteobacteria bacterium]|nr:cupin domain-containing protein [Gammaproteobacteria bacterium]
MSPVRSGNLLHELPERLDEEAFEPLLAGGPFRLQRIVSTGQATPAGEWYDQDDDEWVLLLLGAAELRLDEEPTGRRLAPGDWVLLPAGCRHRVEWTDPDGPTVWLALHHASPGTGR